MKKPEYHRQETMQSCGASCLLMALEAFGVDNAGKGNQVKYYRDYGARSTPGTLGSAIAYVLYSKGNSGKPGRKLSVKIVHASERLLENYGGYFDEEKYGRILAEHKKWLDAAENVKRIKKLPEDSFVQLSGHYFGCGELGEELDKGGLVITQVFVPGDDGMVMHWILLYGRQDGFFKAIDPMPKPVGGKIKLSAEELEEYMKTPFERTYISVWESED